MSASFNLRPYQEASLEQLRDGIRQGKERQVLCLPTGAGKTLVAMALIDAARAKGTRTYFLADRRSLINQTSSRFTEYGLPHGILMGSDSRRLWENTIIASVQTLVTRGFDWEMPSRGLFETSQPAPDPGLIIWDECHEIYKALAKQIVKRDIRMVGLSATPVTDGLGRIFDAVVNPITTTELIRQKYLVPMKVIAPEESQIDTNDVPVGSNGEWQRGALSERVLQVTGEMVPLWEKLTTQEFGGPVQTIVFCPSIVDAIDAAEKFQQAGHSFAVVHSQQGDQENQDLIDAYVRGEYRGIVNCAVLTKGFDAPATRCLIDAYPVRKSLKMLLQRWGRLIRTALGKKFGLLIDMADNWGAFDRRAGREQEP